MKALKIVVVGLVLLIAGLLFTIRRMAQQSSGDMVASAPAPPAQTAPPSEPPAPAPAVSPSSAPEPPKPSPVAPRRPLTKPRQSATEAPVAPSPAPPRASEPPSPAPAPEAPAHRPEPAPAPPAPRRVVIPAGASVVVRTQNTLSTERNFGGDTFSATLEEPLVIDGFVIAERGATVEGHIVRSEKAGRVEGLSSLSVELVRLRTSDGQNIALATDAYEVRGQRSRGSDAKKVGVATGVGAIIGAIAGGGKGAAIGAGVGAGAGAGSVLATRGEHATIPSESRLTFHVRTPVEITERR